MLLGDGQIGEVGAEEIGRVGGVFVLGLLHHRGVDIRVFADEEFDARAFALQEAFQFAHQEGHAGQIPIAGGDVEGGEALVAQAFAQHLAQARGAGGVVDEAIRIRRIRGEKAGHGRKF